MPPQTLALPKLKADTTAIVTEIINYMKATLTTTGKSFSSTALSEWQPKLEVSVFTRLVLGGNWATDKANVLAVAGDMALISGIISASSATVTKARVHAAYRAVKEHVKCPSVGQGGGRWCNFDI
jgi:hypothetical protein